MPDKETVWAQKTLVLKAIDTGDRTGIETLYVQNSSRKKFVNNYGDLIKNKFYT